MTGMIRGVVRFDGTPPQASKIPLAGFAQCNNPKDSDDDVLIQDGKVRNAFVYIKRGLEDTIVPNGSGEVVLDQAGCLYRPRVIGLQLGQTLVIRNGDAFLHNVHGLPKFSSSFNLTTPARGTEARRTFEEPEVMVPIRCDVHPWMRAYVGVLPHPYFAVSGADGSFELKNVPAGPYTLEVWHERLGTLALTTDVRPGMTQSVSIAFK